MSSSLLNSSFLPSLKLPNPTRHARVRYPTRIHAKIREIFMPALSSTMTEGKIVSWIKSEGDKLSKGESVVVVESDKADMDVETFYDGYLAAIVVPEGSSAPVGSAIALLAESEEEIEQARSKALQPSSDSVQDSVQESPKESSPAPPPPAPAAAAAAPAPAAAAVAGGRVVATPYAKKLAKEKKVELAGVVGTGPMGRIVAKDVEAATEAAAGGSGGAVKVGVTFPVGVELGSVVSFTTMQRAVSRNMVDSLSMPTFRVGYTITTDALDELYKKIEAIHRAAVRGLLGLTNVWIHQDM